MTSPLGNADTVQVAIVPDFARFPAELRRGVDQAMREFTARVDAALQGVEANITDSARQLGVDFQAGGEVAERAFRELDATARREMASVTATTTAAAAATSRRFQAAGALAGAAFLGAGVAIAAGLGLLTAMGLKSAATLEQTQIAFNALLGSAEEGTRVFKELQHFAAFTPFEFTEITPVAQRFFTFADALGMAKSQVTEFLTVLGNLASITGAGAFGMERAALAMSQMAGRGRLSAQDINQLTDAFGGGFNVRAAIASELGMSLSDTMVALENGTIDAKTGLHALMEGMKKFPGAAGAMEAQSKTLLGVWSTFKDVFGQALVAGFAPVIPAIKQALADITPVLGEAMASLAPALGGLLVSLMKLIAPLVKAISAGILPLVEAFGKAIDNIDPKMWDQLTMAMVELGEALAPLVPLLVEFLVAGLEIAIPILLAFAKVLQALAPVFNFMTDSVHELNRALAMIDWAAVGEAIAGFFTDLWHDITGFFADLSDGLGDIPGQATAAFTEMRESAAARINGMIASIKALPGRVVAALGDFGKLLHNAGRNLIHGLWSGILSRVDWILNKVSGLMGAIVRAGKAALGIHSESKVMAEEIGRWIPPGIGAGIDNALPALRAQLAGVGAALPAAVTGGAAMAGGGSVTFGPGSVVVQFTGAAPTAQQAFDTGLKVGQGIMDAINRRGVATATKQRA